MKYQLTAIVLTFALGCSGGTGSEGDADTGTEPAEDPTGETATDPTADPAVDPTPDAIPDGTADGVDDPVADPEEDTVTDPEPDPTSDPSIEPYPDPRPDPTTDPTTDPSIEPYPDPRPDTHPDPALDGPCVDPCSISTVSGCGADCGGFAGTPCPHSSLTCVYPTGVTAGICIPTSALACRIDAECTCFPSFHICTSGGRTTTWSCSSGSCGLACT